MEPYKAKKMPLEYSRSNELYTLLDDTIEKYGEYKGYLKNMSFDYKNYLENAFISDLYYSFKIDNCKLQKEYMFHTPYMNNSNEVIEFNNLKKGLLIGVTDALKQNITIDTFHKINKALFQGCKKNNNTKGSGKFRKKQNFLLKPGLAGSSVSFVPPVYTELDSYMKDLIEYINSSTDNSIISTILTHFQFEKLHPYVSGNGKIGRLIIPIQLSLYKKEPPILFISKSLDGLKNTYFTLLSGEVEEDINKFIKMMLQCMINECNVNIKNIVKLNQIYNEDFNSFKERIGGSTIYKVYPVIIKKIVFTTNDLVKETGLHINSINKVINKLLQEGYLVKEKKKGTNRVTFCYKKMYDVYVN